jgi:hypothetical protein
MDQFFYLPTIIVLESFWNEHFMFLRFVGPKCYGPFPLPIHCYCPLRVVDTNTAYCYYLRNFFRITDAFVTAVSSTATESYMKLTHFQWVAWNLSAEVTSLHATITYIYFKTFSGNFSSSCVIMDSSGRESL